MHTWWHLARCQASDGFALLLHSHPCPSARFTEVHKVMYVIHRVCHFCCRPKFQRVQTHGQAKLLLQRVLCKRFGNTYIHTGLSEEQVWWFRTQVYIHICIYIYIYIHMFAICHMEKHHVLPRPFASLLSIFILHTEGTTSFKFPFATTNC